MRPKISMRHDDGRVDSTRRCLLTIDRGLKSGRLDDVELTADDLVRLVRDAGNCLVIMRGLRG